MTIKKYCEHCYPGENNHREEKWNSLIEHYFYTPIKAWLPKKRGSGFGKKIIDQVIHFSQWIKHSEYTKSLDRSQFNNGILVIWDEAMRRGLDLSNIAFGKRHTQYFVLNYQNKKYYFDRSPIYLITEKFKNFADAKQYDDKAHLKLVLTQHQIPCPKGRAFTSMQRALQYGLECGFPLVVKPAISSFSRHVSFNIQSKEALQKALRIAKQIHCRVIVEEYIPGTVHRVTLFNDAIMACTKREASSVIGNGFATIEELIDEKNNHPWRGEPHQLNYTLHKIAKNDSLNALLVQQGVHLKTRLPKDQKVFLAVKMNNGNGSDVSNATPHIHPENAALFLKIHKILHLPITAIDFICRDVSLPWQHQPFAIIENNSLPYIDAHHYPSIGEPINVASKIWDYVLETISPYRAINIPK